MFDSTSGHINEEAHHYIMDNELIPQGASPIDLSSTWSPLRRTFDPALINTAQPRKQFWKDAPENEQAKKHGWYQGVLLEGETQDYPYR